MELATTTSDRFLRHALERMLSVAWRVPDPLLNERPAGDDTNSVAALVVHCCGVVEYWLGHVAFGEPTTRDRDGEFTATATIEELTALVTSTLERAGYLLQRLDEPRAHDSA
ncbi:MAG: DinB family protein, partial [Ilumatobacter sp.]|nr:DinB family protein [Ilumatobacter sp.]